MSDECKDFISKVSYFVNNMWQLLEKDPANRLGSKNGLEEILAHPWIQSIDLGKLEKKEIEAPFKPTLSKDIMDVSNFDKQFTSEEAIHSVIP